MGTDLEGAVAEVEEAIKDALADHEDWLIDNPDMPDDGPDDTSASVWALRTILDALASITRERDEARALLGVESINGVLGYCLDQDRCGCGGDVPAIRATCDNWCKLKEQAAALVNGEGG